MAPRSQEFQQKYQELKGQYLAKLPARLAKVEAYWDQLCNVSWQRELLARLQNDAHQFAGTAGNFGLSDLSKSAASLDATLRDLLAQNTLPTGKDKKIISELIDSMKSSSRLNEQLLPLDVESHELNLKVLLVDDDLEHAELLALVCEQWGCDVVVENHVSSSLDRVVEFMPDVILMDIIFPEGGFAGIDAIKGIEKHFGYHVPVIFMSSRNDLDARLKALRAGGEAYLTKPLDPIELKGALENIKAATQHYAKILVVDDNASITRYLTMMLNSAGFQTVECNDAINVINMIEKHEPDAMLLDLNMPKLKGDAIMAVLQQDPKYFHLPVIFVTADASDATRERLAASGAYGFVAKPVDEAELLKKLQGALKRSVSIKQLVNQVTKGDVADPICNRLFFYSELEKHIALGANDGHNYLLVNVMMRNVEYLRHQIGRTMLETLNRRILVSVKHEFPYIQLVTDASDLNYLLLLKLSKTVSIRQVLTSLLEFLQNVSPEIKGEKVILDPALGAIRLDHYITNVDDALQKVEHCCMKAFQKQVEAVEFVTMGDTRTLGESASELELLVNQKLDQMDVQLVYQPIMDMTHEERIFEGFARMAGLNDKTLLPEQFMPLVLESQLQHQFNRAIVSRAIDDLTNHRDSGPAQTEVIIKLSFANESPLRFLAWLSDHYDSEKLPGDHRIIFSLRENIVLQERAKIQRFVDGLRSLHCGFLLDYAGETAYSNQLIQELKIAYVKLDRQLVQAALEKDSQATTRIMQIVNTCQGIVVAPYVENATNFAMLWGLGIRHFQGYFVKAPEATLDFDFDNEEFG